MAKGEITVENTSTNSGTRHSFLLYLMCFHSVFLYVIIFCLYGDIREIQRTMHEFTANVINLTAKEVQLQTKFLQEFAPECPNSDRIRRNKREAPFANRSRFDATGFSRKSHVPSNLDERHGGPERKNSERRGKKNKKKNRKNRRKRCHGFSPRASHFIGALPEPIIKDGGLLAPWLVENESVKDFGLVTNVPSRGRDAVEIVETGLYFIYAQLYYMATPEQTKAHHSFVIILKPSSGPERQLAHCATLGDSSLGSESSCFTGAAHTLVAGDLIYIKQRERDRHIVMRPGSTFLGLVLLSKRERN